MPDVSPTLAGDQHTDSTGTTADTQAADRMRSEAMDRSVLIGTALAGAGIAPTTPDAERELQARSSPGEIATAAVTAVTLPAVAIGVLGAAPEEGAGAAVAAGAEAGTGAVAGAAATDAAVAASAGAGPVAAGAEAGAGALARGSAAPEVTGAAGRAATPEATDAAASHPEKEYDEDEDWEDILKMFGKGPREPATPEATRAFEPDWGEGYGRDLNSR